MSAPTDWALGTLLDLLFWHHDDIVAAARRDEGAVERLALTSLYSRDEVRAAAEFLREQLEPV